MKLVIIFGPHAVGKMTVGQELAKITELKLFHNHMTIELVASLFDLATGQGRQLINMLRKDIFEEFSKSDMYGMIFTYMWAFDQQSDWDYVEWLHNLFHTRGADIYYVELEADFNVRIDRNKTPNRLENKPTKRNIEDSEALFRNLEAKYRLNSYTGEVKRNHYIRINNTDMPPTEVAKIIADNFLK